MTVDFVAVAFALFYTSLLLLVSVASICGAALLINYTQRTLRTKRKK